MWPHLENLSGGHTLVWLFPFGDLDGFSPRLNPKCLNLSLKVFLCILILLVASTLDTSRDHGGCDTMAIRCFDSNGAGQKSQMTNMTPPNPEGFANWGGDYHHVGEGRFPYAQA